MAGEEKQSQQAVEAPMKQEAPQEDETSTRHLLTMTGALILGLGISFFVSGEIFFAIFVYSFCAIPIFAIALAKSKNATAKTIGVIILVLFIVLFIAACCAFFFLMAKYD